MVPLQTIDGYVKLVYHIKFSGNPMAMGNDVGITRDPYFSGIEIFCSYSRYAAVNTLFRGNVL